MSACPRASESTGVLLVFLFVGTFALCIFSLRKAFQPVRFRPLETTALSFFSVAFLGMRENSCHRCCENFVHNVPCTAQIQQIVGAESASCVVVVVSYYFAAAGFSKYIHTTCMHTKRILRTVGVLAWRAVRVSALYTIQRLLLSDAESNNVADQDGSGDSDDASDPNLGTSQSDFFSGLAVRNTCEIGRTIRQPTLSSDISEAEGAQGRTILVILNRAMCTINGISCRRQLSGVPKTKLGMIRKLRSLASRKFGRLVAAAVALPLATAGVVHASLRNTPQLNCTRCTAGGSEHLVVLGLSALLAGPLFAACNKLVHGVTDAFTVVIELKSLVLAFVSVTIGRYLLGAISYVSSNEPAHFASDLLGIAFAMFCVCFSLLFPSRESFREKFAAANAEAAAGALISNSGLTAFDEAALAQEGSCASRLGIQDHAAWKLGWGAAPHVNHIVSFLAMITESQGENMSAQVMDRIYNRLQLGASLNVLPSGTFVLESAFLVESVMPATADVAESGQMRTTSNTLHSVADRTADSSSSKGSGSYTGFGRRLAAFDVDRADFSAPTLALVLRLPKLRKLFKAYLRNEFSAENLLFWEKVETLNRIHQRLAESSAAIHDLSGQSDVLQKQEIEQCRQIIENFIEVDGPLQVNIPASQRHAILQAGAEGSLSVQMFDQAHEEIFNLMRRDGYSRFKSTSEFALGLKKAELKLMKRKRRSRDKASYETNTTYSEGTNSAAGSSVYDGTASDEPDDEDSPFTIPSSRKFSSPKTSQGGGAADPFSNPGSSKRFSSPKAAQSSDTADPFSKPAGSQRFSTSRSARRTQLYSSGSSAKVAPAP